MSPLPGTSGFPNVIWNGLQRESRGGAKGRDLEAPVVLSRDSW